MLLIVIFYVIAMISEPVLNADSLLSDLIIQVFNTFIWVNLYSFLITIIPMRYPDWLADGSISDGMWAVNLLRSSGDQ